jgi:hypothetical protein
VFRKDVFARERSILGAIPAEFRVGINTVTTSHEEAGTAVDPGVLTGTIESATERQLTEFKKLVEQRELDFSVLGTLTNYKMTPEQQLESLVATVTDVAPSPSSFSATTVESEIKALGGGLWLVTEGTVPDVFQAKRSSINTLDLIPQEFRGLIPDFEVSEIVAGTIVDPPLLTGTEIAKTEEQITVFKKKVSARTLGNPTLPLTYANQELGAEQFGGELLSVELTLNSSPLTIPVGEDVTEAITRTLSPSLYLRSVKKRSPATSWPIITSRLWDPEMRIEYDQTEQVVASGTPEDPNPGVFGWVSEVKAIDQWRSRKTNTRKNAPPYASVGSALISYEFKPFKFPGLLPTVLCIGVTCPYPKVRRASARIVKHTIRTWWETGTVAPTPAFDEIITDSAVTGDPTGSGVQQLDDVLHDDFWYGTLFYPATTPSYTEYAVGAYTGVSGIHNYASLADYGTTGGYFVGQVLFIAGGGYSMSITVLSTYDISGYGTGFIGAYSNGTGNFPVGGPYGPFTASAGDATFYVSSLLRPGTTAGTAWIGSERVVAMTVAPEKEKNVWKVQTESVVMR